MIALTQRQLDLYQSIALIGIIIAFLLLCWAVWDS